ncbi:inositol monophosphatase family protein [Nocardia stercoris]|uniref:Inositol monophosphatase n=1 Tax=Nocardia stercoris TaxID=2483361 RepID=A0A3M2KSI5_9NOCA|nr:inositol monophosphatase family protein [Nocardia stercoris]RMI28449.1 hypothetical protein EBN03_29945 [Nocardia stercoris]
MQAPRTTHHQAFAVRPEAKAAIIDAVTQASRALLGMWPGRPGAPRPVTTMKADNTAVSMADLASQAILLDGLRSVGHDEVVVTEEDVRTHTLSASTVWFVDPLDGTRQYLSGSRDFAVLVSGWSSGKPVYSVAGFPANGILAVADGTTVTHIGPEAGGRPTVHAVYCDPPGLRGALGSGTEYLVDCYESTRVLVEVARRYARGAVVEMCGHRAWDIAAPIHLITAAGGCVTDEQGRTVSLTTPQVQARYLVAATDASTHRALLDALSDPTDRKDPEQR